MIEEQLKKLHDYCHDNKEALAKSTIAGCFYCCEMYHPGEVTTFVSKGKDALCPKCGIDSVIGDSQHEINEEILRELHVRWF